MILVDELFDGRAYYHGPSAGQARSVGSRTGHMWCHMTSDTSEFELHDFALRLGLRRSWFDKDHYDLTPNKRVQAIRMGAQAVTVIELVQRGLRKNKTGEATPG